MVRNLFRLMAVALPLLLGPAQGLDAAGPEAEPIRTVQLLLSPQPEPQYALKYLFETPYADQRPGNGALLYHTAISQLLEIKNGDEPLDRQTLRQWVDLPFEELPLEKVRGILAKSEPILNRLDLATRSEQCLWESTVREEGLGYMNPHLGEYRQIVELLILKARLQTHDGALDDAIDTLRMGLTIGRDISRGPTLIENLVGVAVAARTTAQVEQLIQAPEAPNLYWALTALPQPLADMRTGMQMESAFVNVQIPELQRLEETVLSNEQVMDLWNKAMGLCSSDFDAPARTLTQAAALLAAMKVYPEAKTRLIEQGHNANEVESWPPLYVMLVDQYRQYRTLRDMLFKWTTVPYWQAHEGMAQAVKAMQDYMSRNYMNPMATVFLSTLPAIERIHSINARLARNIAMLRCVEAIRLYAADHDGALPRSLDDVTAVPIPIDPLRGQPFDYRVTGKTATLESPVPSGMSPRDGQRYEITIRQPATAR